MSSTTLAKRSIGPAATTNQRKKLMLRTHDFVGIFFGVILISPTWLFLLEPNLVVAVRDAYGAQQASEGIAVILLMVLVMTVVAVVMTKPTEES